MRPFLSWKNVTLLLFAHAALTGCVTHRAAVAPDALDAAAEADVRAKAELLCRHDAHRELVPSRLPEGVSPDAYVRPEDLAFVVNHPEKVAPTPLDKLGLHAELARHVRCEATSVQDPGYIVSVSLKRTAPRFPTEALLGAASREEARALLQRWMQQGPELVTTEASASFVKTAQGPRATYWLPESAEAPADKSDWPEDPLPTERMTPPRRIEGPKPQYTAKALEHRVEGAWAARCILTREGRQTRCRVLKSLPYMDEVLIQTFQATRYEPVTYKGKPVEIEFFYNVRLQLPRR